MASNRITTNEPTKWQSVSGSSVHIGIAGTFDGASVALEQMIFGTVYPVRDVDKVPIVYTEATDENLLVEKGDEIRLSPTGGTSPVIDFNIAGASETR